MKMIGIDDSIHKRVKVLSTLTDRKIYQIIEEAVIYLEEKYHISRTIAENNHE